MGGERGEEVGRERGRKGRGGGRRQGGREDSPLSLVCGCKRGSGGVHVI